MFILHLQYFVKRKKGAELVTIQVSGKRIEVEDGITVMRLMELQKVETPQNVTVTLNNVFLPVDRYECYTLQEGDTVEFLCSMGSSQLSYWPVSKRI